MRHKNILTKCLIILIPAGYTTSIETVAVGPRGLVITP